MTMRRRTFPLINSLDSDMRAITDKLVLLFMSPLLDNS